MNIRSLVQAFCPAPLRSALGRLENSPLGYRLATGVFWSMAGAFISRGLMMVAMILVAQILGKSVYGEFGIVRSTVNMFIVFAGFGLGITATKHVAEFRDSDPMRAGRVIATSNAVAIVTGGIVTGGLLVFAPWLATHTLAAPHLEGVLRIGAVILFINALNGAQTGALSGFEAFKTIAKVNFEVGLASFPLLVGGAYLWGVTGAVVALAVNMAIHWLLNHIALRREAARFNVPLSLKHCTQEWPVLWKFSLPAVAASVMVGPAKWVCDALLVNQDGGFGEMGILTATLVFQNAIVYTGGMFGLPLLSMLCNAEGKVSDRLGRVNILASWIIGVALALPLMCFPEVVERLFGTDYGGQEFRITLVLVLFYTCVVMYQQGFARVLAANDLMWWGFFSNAVWAVVLIGSAWSLAHRGAVGIAASFVIAYVINTLVTLPIYYSKNLIPKGTLLSINSVLIWCVLVAMILFQFFGISVRVRLLFMVPSLLLMAFAFIRIAAPSSPALERSK